MLAWRSDRNIDQGAFVVLIVEPCDISSCTRCVFYYYYYYCLQAFLFFFNSDLYFFSMVIKSFLGLSLCPLAK